MSRSTTQRPVVAIEWNDIQGNVLRGYGFDHGRHLVATVDDPEWARRWLAAVLPAVTTAAPWDDRPITTLNVAFTHRGLAALGVPASVLARLPAELGQGMRARAREHLGDIGPADPAGWSPTGPHQPEAHVLVMVHSPSGDAADEAAARIGRELSSGGLALLHTERLANLAGPSGFDDPRRVEHFGFADGIVQPAVEGAMAPTVVRGNGTYLGEGRWRPVPPGEFVFGYPDDEEDEPPLPGPAWLVRNGTLLVWRKLAQDVAAFRRLVLEHGTDHPGGADLLAAQLVGRWPDGTSFADELSAGGTPNAPACPLSSHIRRSNPRHALTAAPELVSRHRMLRRGMPYGPPLAPHLLDDDGVDRGLLFMAYCTDVRRQFEFVQREWLNDGNSFGVGNSPDPIAGQGDAPRCFVVPATAPPGDGAGARVIGGLPQLVRTVAGEYLFQPGLQALHRLAHA